MTDAGSDVRHSRRRVLAGAGAALSALTLAGCTGNGATQATTTTAGPADTSTPTETGGGGGAGTTTAGAGETTTDAGGESAREYRVTVADLTSGQPFTPPAVAAHTTDVEVFSVGEPANEPTQQVAENGNLQPLVEFAQGSDQVRGTAVGDAPLVPAADPGGTGNSHFASLTLEADAAATHLSFVSMLIATNDGFVGLDTVPLPDRRNASFSYYANGYDAGTEQNTERFADMVPPAQFLVQGGEAEGGTAESDPDLAEYGVVRPHAGIQGDADLDPEVYGWDEPAGLLVVERIA